MTVRSSTQRAPPTRSGGTFRTRGPSRSSRRGAEHRSRCERRRRRSDLNDLDIDSARRRAVVSDGRLYVEAEQDVFLTETDRELNCSRRVSFAGRLRLTVPDTARAGVPERRSVPGRLDRGRLLPAAGRRRPRRGISQVQHAGRRPGRGLRVRHRGIWVGDNVVTSANSRIVAGNGIRSAAISVASARRTTRRRRPRRGPRHQDALRGTIGRIGAPADRRRSTRTPRTSRRSSATTTSIPSLSTRPTSTPTRAPTAGRGSPRADASTAR